MNRTVVAGLVAAAAVAVGGLTVAGLSSTGLVAGGGSLPLRDLGTVLTPAADSLLDDADPAAALPDAGRPIPAPSGSGPSGPALWGVVTSGDLGDGAREVAPTRVVSDAIDLDAPLIDLGTLADGSLEVPSTTTDVGWLTTSAVPGEIGPSVLAGHVDSKRGPAVFYRLPDLVPGDLVTVTMSDASSRTFAVTHTIRVGKDRFPADEVYGPVPDAQLRLITCGGAFDRTVRSYVDNVIVFARLVSSSGTS